MTALLIGYAPVSTDEQDLTAQRDALQALGVQSERIYVDHGLTSRQVKLALGTSVHDPTGPIGRLLFNGWPWSPSLRPT